MEIHCYCCGLEIGERTAEIPTAAHLMADASHAWVRELLARTVFRHIPPASFCSFCLAGIVAFTDLFHPTRRAPHTRFDQRVAIGGHSSTAEWATCVDCGVTLRERSSPTTSLLPPDVRLRRRMLLHAAAMHYGRDGNTQLIRDLLDHRDGA